MVTTRSNLPQSESDSSTMAVLSSAKDPSGTSAAASASTFALPLPTTTKAPRTVTTHQEAKVLKAHRNNNHKTNSSKHVMYRRQGSLQSLLSSSSLQRPLAHIRPHAQHAPLIKGTSHIHFHENIRVAATAPPKKRPRHQPQQQQSAASAAPPPQQVPQVVKLLTGTLYIFTQPKRRVVLVRHK